MNQIDYGKIYKALYVLNKSAKKSRDTANRKKDEGIALRSRNRKNLIYRLKHAVMDKLMDENKLKFEGIHFQSTRNSTGFYLAYFKTEEGFSYHRPATKDEIEALQNKELNEMTVVPAFVKRKEDLISYTEAVDLCCRYLGIHKNQIQYLKKRSVVKKDVS